MLHLLLSKYEQNSHANAMCVSLHSQQHSNPTVHMYRAIFLPSALWEVKSSHVHGILIP